MIKLEKLDLLISLYIFCVAVSELMGGKTFPILTSPIKLNASVAIFVIPVIFSINDVITEVLGKERARSVVWSGLVVILLILLFSLLATSLFISQFVDTTTFISLAFYALDKPFTENIGFLWSLILPYWLLKTFMSVIEPPFVYLGVKWLRDKN